VVTSAIAEAEEGTQSIVDHLGESEDIENDLRVFTRQHIIDVTQPHLILMRRMIIAEANRFPELARAWHRRALSAPIRRSPGSSSGWLIVAS
jgi:TetR/AcrR family transcriptional repressor of mexJK operon